MLDSYQTQHTVRRRHQSLVCPTTVPGGGPRPQSDVVVVVVVVVVVAFSSLARILGECSTIHFPPAIVVVCCCCCCLGSGGRGVVEISLRKLIPLFYAKIGPQWQSELQRLWLNVP